MRRLKIMIGLAVVACSMMAVFASPSFAKKEKVFFGHFTSSINGKTISPTSPATAKGKGEVDELKVGPLSMECVTKSGFTLAATALVEAERSSNLTSTVKITGCKTDIKFGKGGNFTPAKVNFGKGIKMEFHANGSVAVGNPNPPGGEVKILETAPVEVKVAGQKCKLFIPAQSLPLASEKNPEKEYEAAEYASETEAVEGAKLKKYPSGFKETLDISWELKGIKSYVPVEPGRCEYQKGEEGAYAPAEGELPNRVVYGGGKFEGEIEEMEVKGGNLGFDPTPSEN